MPDSNKISEIFNDFIKSRSEKQIEEASQINNEEEIDLDKKQELAFKEEEITNKKLHNDILKDNAALRKNMPLIFLCLVVFGLRLLSLFCYYKVSACAIFILQRKF